MPAQTAPELRPEDLDEAEAVSAPAFYSVKDLARRYGITEMSIWRWARNGRLPPPLRLSPNVSRWRRSDIVQHEERLAVEAAKRQAAKRPRVRT